MEQIFVMHSDVEQFTSLALIFAIRASNVCSSARVETFTSRCIQSAVAEAKLYFMEMDVESKPTLVAFLQRDSYAGVCAAAAERASTTPRAYRKQ